MKFKKLAVLLLVNGLLLNCVNSGTKTSDDDFDLTRSASEPTELIPSIAMAGMAQYTYEKSPFQVEWMSCHLKDSKSTVLVMNRDLAGFDQKSFCAGWVAQAALAQGKSVAAVNRPGYGASTGTPDFSGPRSLAAIQAGVSDLTEKSKDLPAIKSAWGYSSGATAAALFARRNSSVEALILGGGIFDTEEALQTVKDGFITDSLKEALKNEGDKAHEFRSIAWDTSGLPKRIIIYHGEQDQDIPPEKARSFRDTLATASYQVDIQIIGGIGHRIPPEQHRSILEVLFRAAP